MAFLQQANRAFEDESYATAVRLYVYSLLQRRSLARFLVCNLRRAQEAYWKERRKQLNHEKQHILVSCWDLSHNAVGRATTLAQLWDGIGHAEIVGYLYPSARSSPEISSRSLLR